MATHLTFYVGRLKRYHDPLGLPSRTEEDQGENSPPRNEAESSGQPWVPVLKKMPAGLPTRAPAAHRPPHESKKAFICDGSEPKRVGKPKRMPSASFRVSGVAIG
ncbi:Hypothetical protein PHPALM_5335 [Phytophthora palmivora]|uniref:Pol protein n=1 Tax=Phytophthora palmivora TaxID=4796 RepID=A0A2P4YHL2_9STRA|nr:Hypothetical protein PHPALM_5335 [Phytophthora palmivora]